MLDARWDKTDPTGQRKYTAADVEALEVLVGDMLSGALVGVSGETGGLASLP